MIVACLALALSLGGTSVAAVSYINGKQIKPHSIPKNRLSARAIKALHGARGVQGPIGPTGPAGPAGTVASLDDLNGKPCTIKGQTGIVHLEKPTLKGGFQVSYLCLRQDEWEPNDTFASAVDVNSETNASNTVKFVDPSIYPAGDNDFFKLTHSLDSIDVYPWSSVNGESVNMNIYKDGSLVASNVTGQYNTGDATSHTWTVQVFAAPTTTTAYFLHFDCSGGTC